MTEPQQEDTPEWMAEASVGVLFSLLALWHIYTGEREMAMLLLAGILALAIARIIVREGVLIDT